MSDGSRTMESNCTGAGVKLLQLYQLMKMVDTRHCHRPLHGTELTNGKQTWKTSQSDVYSEFGGVSGKPLVQRHMQSAKRLSMF